MKYNLNNLNRFEVLEIVEQIMQHRNVVCFDSKSQTCLKQIALHNFSAVAKEFLHTDTAFLGQITLLMGGEGKDRFEHFTISTMKTGNVVHCHKGAHTAMRLSLSQSSTWEFFLQFVQSTHVTSSCIAFDQVILYLIVDCVVQM